MAPHTVEHRGSSRVGREVVQRVRIGVEVVELFGSAPAIEGGPIAHGLVDGRGLGHGRPGQAVHVLRDILDVPIGPAVPDVSMPTVLDAAHLEAAFGRCLVEDGDDRRVGCPGLAPQEGEQRLSVDVGGDTDAGGVAEGGQQVQRREQRISKREELKNSLKEMLDHKGSYLLEVMVGKENNVFPMVPQGRGVAEIVLSSDEV